MAETAVKDITWLIETLGEKGFVVASTKVRVILRRLVKNGTIEDVREEGSRKWTFKGVSDPAVKAIVAALKEEAKAPAEKPTKAAPSKVKAKKAPAKKAAPVEELEDDEETFEDDELDLD